MHIESEAAGGRIDETEPGGIVVERVVEIHLAVVEKKKSEGMVISPLAWWQLE